MNQKNNTAGFSPISVFSMLCFIFLFIGGLNPLMAQTVNFKNAVVIVSSNVPSPMKETAAKVLSEEISKRTGLPPAGRFRLAKIGNSRDHTRTFVGFRFIRKAHACKER